MQKKAFTLWFTGRHGAGKSTIASGLARELQKKKISFVLLDGDELRKTVSSDLGYSINERNEHMKRVAHIANYISDYGILVIASVASPTETSRRNARDIIKKMLLVYVKCSLDEASKRDVKGHYKKAKNKEKGFENFIASDYEEPSDADITLDTESESVGELICKLVDFLKKKEILN